MTTIKANGVKYHCPSSWKEVTVEQYIRIMKEWDPDKDIADRDYFKLLQILVGKNFAGLERTVDNELALVDMVGWVITEPFKFDTALPKALSFMGRNIYIPKDPSELPIGQNIHLRRYIEKSELIEENIAIATAIYLQPIIDGKSFHVERAQELAEEFNKMPVWLIYPIGFFLLNRASNFGTSSGSSLKKIQSSHVRIRGKMFRAWRWFNGFIRLTIWRSSRNMR